MVSIFKLSKHKKMNWISGEIINSSSRFHNMHYKHCEEILQKFRDQFGFSEFKPHQYEAVNAALTGK